MVLFVGSLLSQFPRTAQAQEEIFYLKNGGQVRGVLMESDPVQGVSVMLRDGSTRHIAASELAYRGNAGTGSLHVESLQPGRVSVDGAELGASPLDVPNLAAGAHLVRVEFDDGYSAEQRVFVQPGQVAQVELRNSARRQGVAFAVAFGPMVHINAEFGAAPAGLLQLGANLSLSRLLDLRVMALLGVGYFVGEGEAWYQAGVLGAARLNFGATYSMEFGVILGASNSHYTYDDYGYDYDEISISAEFQGGLELSLLSLRLGSRRNVELTLWHALLFGQKGNVQSGLSLTWLFTGA